MLERSPPTPSPLRLRIAGAREIVREQLLGEGSAMEACGAYGEVCDQLVVDRVGVAAEAGLAVIATGGWGRRELCPYSDLDILFLAEEMPRSIPDSAADESAESGIGRVISEDFLFPLWDAGLKVGHSVTDLASIEALAKNDVRTATALLDARLIAGRTDLFLRLEQACRRAIAPGGDSRVFVGRLIDERDRRHRRFGDSLYLLEPNLKQGIGGLRDLATALWVAQVRFGLVSPERLVTSGQLTRRQANVLMSSRDFLLRLRSLVQLFANRATDQLTFELQETIAPLLYPFAEAASASKTRSAVAPAVEELMRDTYLHGSGVTQIMSQLFESAQTSRRRRPTVARIDGSFVLFSGKLSVSAAEIFDRRPAEMLRAFRLATELGVDIHWHTRELIAERTAADLDLTRDRSAAEHFVAALCDTSDDRSPSMLEEMHRVGLVAAVIPAFGPCTGRVQHDLYHVYTVDQHQLHAVNMLKRIARRELESKYPLATEILAALPSRVALFLATLLHDVGKPLGKGHSETGAEIARDAALALGLGGAAAARAEFLVRQHLTMSHVSQRRDLADPAVIERFVNRVGSLDCLRELTLLTMCDTAMTAPGNLTTWKAQLLGELYRAAHRVLDGVTADEPHDDMIGRRRRDLAKLLAGGSGENEVEISALVASIDDHMVVGLKTAQLQRLLTLAMAFDDDRPFVFNVRPFPGKAHTELAVVAVDTPGLLADITGALAVAGFQVLGATIGSVETRGRRLVADMFLIRGPDDAVLGPSDARWQRVVDELTETLSDAGKESLIVERLRRRGAGRLKPRVTPHIRTEVGFADAESERHSVLEVFTQDRLELLSDIARALASMRLEIVLAKISTEGERATDVFYLAERDTGAKLSVAREREVVDELTQRIAELESAESADAPTTTPAGGMSK